MKIHHLFEVAVAALAFAGCCGNHECAPENGCGAEVRTPSRGCFEAIVQNQLAAVEQGDTSVVLTRLADGEELYSYNADEQMPSASTIKVLIMAEIMRRVEAGEIDLATRVQVAPEVKLQDSIIGCLEQPDYSLRDLVTMMIIESDNTATNVLIDLFGMEPVNRLAAELGLEQTSLQRKMLDWDAIKAGRQNYTSAADMQKLMLMIGRRELISPTACDEMIAILNMQKDIESFKRFMPEDLVVAHKSGSLDCLEHETGIFWVPGNDYVLTIFTQKYRSNSACRDFIGKLALAIYNAMGGTF